MSCVNGWISREDKDKPSEIKSLKKYNNLPCFVLLFAKRGVGDKCPHTLVSLRWKKQKKNRNNKARVAICWKNWKQMKLN